MNEFASYYSKNVIVEISGTTPVHGLLIAAGIDLVVLLREQKYYYIPMSHVHRVTLDAKANQEDYSHSHGISFMEQEEPLGLMLQKAIDLFVDISVSSHKPVSGYLREIKSDYLILQSPVYRTIFVSLNHLKWLIPYSSHYMPFGQSAETVRTPMSKDLESVNKFEDLFTFESGNKVVINFGSASEQIGIINAVGSGIVDLTDASGNNGMYPLSHIKTLFVPK
ncbi:hypothetical protein [Paenibacillus glycanilyticus]|uniref:DUF2642 domain-containing protein n=1 Tax=Paenibacillus glycanilyticus TaxID=126569 RepID=A0ABQ6GDI9_9BACL|nr:hypothetical protein [Paenibacillus glycanilyticus]GLX69019.1 hypothetical protein MU1_33640 [Paenibacillus glycanilyticus]